MKFCILASLKTEVDKLDIDKSVLVPVDLRNLNDAVKKDVYNKSVVQVNCFDTGGFVLKTKYDTDKSELEKILADFVKKASLTELENKILDISN